MTMIINISKFRFKCVGAIILFGISFFSFAADDISNLTLKFASFYQPGHPHTRYVDLAFIKRVEELSEGKIKIQHFPAGQLGKPVDYIKLLNSGAFDLGSISPSYVPSELPLSSVGELPNMFKTSCDGSWALYNLMQEGGYLYEKELKGKGLRVLEADMTSPYELMTVSKPITNIESVKGMILKTAGGAAGDTARALGAVPAQITNAEIFTALQRGTVDGRFGVFAYMPAVNSSDLLKYSTDDARVAAFSATIAINEKRWAQLPVKIQNILSRAGREIVNHACQRADADEAIVRKTLEDNHGWKVLDLGAEPAEQKKWFDAMAGVSKSWAESIDKKYGPGSGENAVKAFKESVSAVAAGSARYEKKGNAYSYVDDYLNK